MRVVAAVAVGGDRKCGDRKYDRLLYRYRYDEVSQLATA
jgi:hypothetical protein